MFDEAAITDWRTRVYDRCDEIDPDRALDWYDLAVGFFLGKSLTFEAAQNHASECIERGLV